MRHPRKDVRMDKPSPRGSGQVLQSRYGARRRWCRVNLRFVQWARLLSFDRVLVTEKHALKPSEADGGDTWEKQDPRMQGRTWFWRSRKPLGREICDLGKRCSDRSRPTDGYAASPSRPPVKFAANFNLVVSGRRATAAGLRAPAGKTKILQRL